MGRYVDTTAFVVEAERCGDLLQKGFLLVDGKAFEDVGSRFDLRVEDFGYYRDQLRFQIAEQFADCRGIHARIEYIDHEIVRAISPA